MTEKQTFTFLLAKSVRVYGYAEIEASSPQEAAEIVRKAAQEGDDDQDIWGNVCDVDYSTTSEHSIIRADNEADETVIGNIDLTGPENGYEIISAEELTKAIKDDA